MERKIRVLELHSSFGYAGGGARALVTFAKYLDKSLFEVFAASYFSCGPQKDALSALGIEAFCADGDSGKILDFIRDRKIDIVHIHRSGGTVPIETEIIRGAKSIDPKIVIVEKNVFGMHDPACEGDISCSLFQSMMHVHERYLPASGKRFDFGSMKVFYNPADAAHLEEFRATDAEIAAYRRTLGVGPDDILLGKVARPHIAKWSDLIVEMLPYAAHLVPNLKFVIVGVPASRMKSLARSRFRDRLILIREISDEREERLLYQAIDTLAHSSKIGECNGNAINEAMFWGKPVVTDSTPRRDNGQLEQVDHLRTGIVANSPETFARAVAYLATSPDARRVMGDAARAAVLARNDAPSLARRLEKVFFEALIVAGALPASSVPDRYADIAYSPAEAEIAAYPAEYSRRLLWDFGTRSIVERVWDLARLPRRLHRKIADFFEARFG